MTVALTPDVLNDDIAVSLAKATAAANARARVLGVDVLQCLINVSQFSDQEKSFWRFNYGPKDYIGRRGGDLILDVDVTSADVIREQRGQ